VNFLGVSVEGREPVNPSFPLGIKSLVKVLFPVVVDGRVLDSVQRQLLQVAHIQLPSKSGIDVVEGHGFIAEEGWVIGTDRDLHSVCDQVASGMSAKVEGVTEDHVTERAYLDADVSLLALLDEVWEKGELEAVTDSLCVEQDGVMEVLLVGVVSFSCVHVGVHALQVVWSLGQSALGVSSELLLLGHDDLFSENTHIRPEVFLVHEIVSRDQVREKTLGSTHIVEHFGGTRFSLELESRDDHDELEGMRQHVAGLGTLVLGLSLDLCNFFVDNLHLFLHGDGLQVLIEEDARSMAELNYEDVLLDARLESGSDDSLEEFDVLSKVVDETEFRLEFGPDIVRLFTLGVHFSDTDLTS